AATTAVHRVVTKVAPGTGWPLTGTSAWESSVLCAVVMTATDSPQRPSSCKRYAHQANDNLIREGANCECSQFLTGIKGQIKHSRSAARNSSPLPLKGCKVEHAHLARLQVHAQRQWPGPAKREVIDEIILINRPPCLGIAQRQTCGRTI